MKHLLPALRYARVREPERAGEWTPIGSLADLAQDIDIEGKPDAAVLKSVPDAWAPVRWWRQALLDARHPLHREVRDRWRALLALVALQPTYARQYRLDAYAAALDAGNRDWRGTLDRLRPRDGIAADADAYWRAPRLLRVTPLGAAGAPVTVAMLTPDTLVAAGHSAAALRLSGVPFARVGLSDPLVAGLSATELAILRDHADGLRAELPTAGAAGEQWNRLAGALKDWSDDLARALQGRADAGERVHALMPATASLKSDGLHAPLAATRLLDPTKFRPGDSDTALRLRAGVTAVKGIALADPDLAPSFSRAPAAIHVYREHTLADVLRDLPAARARAAEDGWLILTPADLWTPLLADVGSNALNGHDAACPGPLPLTPLALLLGDAAALRAACAVAPEGDGRAATLRLALADERTTHTLRRRYAGAAEVAKPGIDRSMAVWPDFEAADWPFTFLQSVANPNADLLPTALLSARLLDADLLAVAAGERAARAEAWGSGATTRELARGETATLGPAHDPWLRRMRFKAGAARGEWQLARFGVDAVAAALLHDGAEQPCGLILCAREPARAGNPLNATVAIDFGTSNSIAYALAGQGKRPVTLRARLRPLVAVPPSQREEWGEQFFPTLIDFFAGADIAMPFPTILKLREDPPAAARDWPRAADALFARPPAAFGPGVASGWVARNLLQANIKWRAGIQPDGTPSNAFAEHFLADMLLRIAAEQRADGIAPDRIEWRFSYPQAFRPRELEYFTRMTARVAGALSPGRAPELRSESAAAMAYFMDDAAAGLRGVQPLAVMLDIGGGTTDVAIHQDRRPVWRGSLRLAAGDFFTGWLARNSALLARPELLGEDPAAALPQDDNYQDQRRLLVELAASRPEFADLLGRAIDRQAGTDRQLEALRETASVALGGLLWHVGRALKRLVADGRVDPRAAAAPSIILAGRGATYFRHLPAADRDQLGRLLLAGAELPPADLEPIFSRAAKEEVARGLLEERVIAEEQVDRAMPLGLDVQLSLGAGALPADAPLAALADRRVGDVEMDGFGAFLAALEAATGLRVALADAGRLRGQQLIKQHAAMSLQRDGADAAPPFVTALAKLVELLSLPLDERAAYLRVEHREPAR